MHSNTRVTVIVNNYPNSCFTFYTTFSFQLYNLKTVSTLKYGYSRELAYYMFISFNNVWDRNSFVHTTYVEDCVIAIIVHI